MQVTQRAAALLGTQRHPRRPLPHPGGETCDPGGKGVRTGDGSSNVTERQLGTRPSHGRATTAAARCLGDSEGHRVRRLPGTALPRDASTETPVPGLSRGPQPGLPRARGRPAPLPGVTPRSWHLHVLPARAAGTPGSSCKPRAEALHDEGLPSACVRTGCTGQQAARPEPSQPAARQLPACQAAPRPLTHEVGILARSTGVASGRPLKSCSARGRCGRQCCELGSRLDTGEGRTGSPTPGAVTQC